MKNIVICNNCNTENKKGTHYCKKCGKNISDLIEVTDVLFFISSIMKWCSILTLIFVFPLIKIFEGFVCTLEICENRLSIKIILFCAIMFVVSLIIKKITLNKCKKNI